jgi:ParB/RepB/Spo0J family partition protein
MRKVKAITDVALLEVLPGTDAGFTEWTLPTIRIGIRAGLRGRSEASRRTNQNNCSQQLITKPANRKKPAMLAPSPVSAEMITESIDVEKLHDHPANPESRIRDHSVDDLMHSIDEFGQREPVRVRTINDPIGHYQILSGHRRAEACRRLERPVMCIVVEADDHEALREVMLGNASREDLNIIERAELLQVMIDSGVDRAEAGRLFGLTSDSGIKNTLRMLKLPRSIRKMVESGEIPARAARALVPYAAATLMLDTLAKDLKDDEWSLADFVRETEWRPDRTEYRPMDGKTKYSPSWQHEDAVRGFDLESLNERDRKALAIVSIPVGENGKSIEVAQNVELFDTLNAIYVKKRSGYGGSKEPKLKGTADKPLTPAQLKAEEKRKAKEADERLAKRLPIWRRRFMRCTLATMVEPGHVVILASLPWWIAKTGGESMAWILRAARTLGCASPKDYNGSLTHCIASITDGNVELIDRLWRVLVWPQCGCWPIGSINENDQEITADLPTKMVLDQDYESIDDELVMQLELAKLTMAISWNAASGIGLPQRQLFEEFLGLHTTAQLMKLAIDWNLKPFQGDKKAQIITMILNAHLSDSTSSRRLPMPKCLESPKPKAKGKR